MISDEYQVPYSVLIVERLLLNYRDILFYKYETTSFSSVCVMDQESTYTFNINVFHTPLCFFVFISSI